MTHHVNQISLISRFNLFLMDMRAPRMYTYEWDNEFLVPILIGSKCYLRHCYVISKWGLLIYKTGSKCQFDNSIFS